MSAIPITSQPMTLEEYLEFDYNAEGRYEYFDGEVIEMSGGSPEHSLLGSRLSRLLGNQLDLKGCLAYSSEVKIKVPTMLPYRYGDVSALCGQPIYELFGKQRLLTNPSLIVEVLSPSTEKYDRVSKLKAYKSIESLREYMLVWQDRKFVMLFTKHNEKFWFQSEYVGGETLKLESLECDLSVDEIYQGILPEPEQ
ncbi:MAG: Uma2 family endonuclease [Pyrinomonadaceae bacterium]|nr:Uma2 family endonuclease [Pyrinomonadaceae bacterium]